MYVDPRDVGDGMDAYGNPIHYPDEEPASTKDEEEDDERPKLPNAELLFDFVDSAPTPEGTLHILAQYARGLRRPVVKFLRIEPAPPPPDAAPPPSAILPVEMPRDMRERLSRLGEEGAVWWMLVERKLTTASTEKFVATKLVPKRKKPASVFTARDTGKERPRRVPRFVGRGPDGSRIYTVSIPSDPTASAGVDWRRKTVHLE